MGERRAEERHDAVAHHLVDRALVAVDGLHHALEHRVEELASVFRVTISRQLHRALEVGEEDGDLLALALQRSLGGQDLLREVFGGCSSRGMRSAPTHRTRRRPGRRTCCRSATRQVGRRRSPRRPGRAERRSPGKSWTRPDSRTGSPDTASEPSRVALLFEPAEPRHDRSKNSRRARRTSS